MHYAEVLVDVANRRLDQSFHYRIPEGLQIEPGMRILVPLKHRQVQGIVIGLSDRLPNEVPESSLKAISGKVEDVVAVPETLIRLALWLAETTVCPIAVSLHAVWPLLKGKTEDWVIPLVDREDPDIQALKVLDPETYEALAVLFRSRKKALALSVYLKRSGITKTRCEQLIRQGWLRIESRFSSGAAAGNRQLECPEVSALEKDDRDILPESLIGYTEDMALASGSDREQHKELTLEQEDACQRIEKGLQEQTAQTFLMHGVTGSGKTEVYRRLIRQVMQFSGSAILLVPEISLTSQVVRYFAEEFGRDMIVLHSGLSPGAKVKAWQEILSGNKRLVIGARSAVFAPLPRLRLIILDEEHDGAYKQEENPKYHARDVARKRMEQECGIVVLGSATPSLEAYAAAQSGKIAKVELKKRVADRPLPPVEIVDMREELIKGNRSIFSLALQDKLKDRLKRGEQCMLFLNRRGYSTFVMCRECGYVVRCRDCDVSLTYHSHGNSMQCHYCNRQEIPPHTCPECGSRYIRFFGQGTQRVEEELQVIHPETRILRLDRDTTRGKDAYREILGSFRRQESEILVGTQMMAKGLDFPNVTLVGVIAIDSILHMPDFRARERTFQLLTQVAGRAGRSDKPGEVVIQTYSPEDRAIVRASRHDYTGFFWEELGYRKALNYPPFTHVIRVTLLSEQENRVIKAAHALAERINGALTEDEHDMTHCVVLGPAPALIPRLKNRFRWQVSVKGKRLDELREYLHRGVQKFAKDATATGVQLNIEVDPLSTG